VVGRLRSHFRAFHPRKSAGRRQCGNPAGPHRGPYPETIQRAELSSPAPGNNRATASMTTAAASSPAAQHVIPDRNLFVGQVRRHALIHALRSGRRSATVPTPGSAGCHVLVEQPPCAETAAPSGERAFGPDRFRRCEDRFGLSTMPSPPPKAGHPRSCAVRSPVAQVMDADLDQTASLARFTTHAQMAAFEKPGGKKCQHMKNHGRSNLQLRAIPPRSVLLPDGSPRRSLAPKGI